MTFPDCLPDLNVSSVIEDLLGTPLTGLAMVCAIGDQPTSVMAFITPDCGAYRPHLHHAVQREEAYSDRLLSFDECETPFYDIEHAVDLASAAQALGVDRVLCLITLDKLGAVGVQRDYDDLEVTLLEATHTQLTRFNELLGGATPPRLH